MLRRLTAGTAPPPAQCCGPDIVSDQTAVAQRDDVLVYTSAPLEEDVTVIGEILARLFVSTDVKDTDIAVKLVDVHPDGTAYNVTDSILRLRYRDGFVEPRLMEPGKVYEVDIVGMVSGIQFPSGHRIRLEIAGTNFPNYERNMNTGGRNFDEDRPIPAEITVHSGPEYPSSLVLPVVTL